MNYPVKQINPEWVLEPEQLGTKDKFWIKTPDSSADWLLKFPTAGTGQHWAEKIAYEIACKVNVLAPKVELAEMNGEKGTITENFTKDGYDLFHGNQIIAQFDTSYDRSRRFHQNNHTIHAIFESLDRLWKNKSFATKAKYKFARYLVLDALICNVDRHHENWGVLRKPTSKGPKGRLAPSFDHASSMGRELNDDSGKQNRARYLDELGVAKYISRGRGPIFVDGEGKYGPSPIRLIERCLKIDDLKPYFKDAIKIIGRIQPEDFEIIINAIPEDWMSELSRKFTNCLLCETRNQLIDLA